MKKQCWKKGIVFAAAAIGAILLAGADTASAKTGKVELNLTGTPVQNRRPQALERAKKVSNGNMPSEEQKEENVPVQSQSSQREESV